MTVALRSAIVGLGQVGMLFDDDSRRRRVWTHFSAYERLADRFDLVAVCEPDTERLERAAARRPGVRTYRTLDELLDAEVLDVLSVCTPLELHAEQVSAAAGRVRAVVCEKPLGADMSSSERAVEACSASATLLAVNFYKRFEPAAQTAAQMIRSGEIGTVRSATALYTGPLDAVGSHAIDLLHFLVGPLELVDATVGPTGASALLGFGGGSVAVLLSTGPREDLLFEVDVVGSEGRLRILDNCARLEFARFEESSRYGGYRELARAAAAVEDEGEPFLLLFAELADALDGLGEAGLTSSGASALGTQSILDGLSAHVG